MSSSKTPDDQRIAKMLARAGIASRREVERMIAEGRIALNGAVIETPATLLASLAGVTVDGKPVRDAEPARLFLYHKPKGLLVTERDPKGRPTIYDRLPKGLPRVVPVGRLDLATEGLLLLTTDGGLKRQLELPATGVERVYRARAYGDVTQAQLEELIEGVEIEGVRYGAIDANMERRTGANVWIELKLTEGKNREVRRVLEHLGLEVSRLIRTRYGPFVLGDLPVGAVGEVRAHDVDSFRKNPTRLDLPQPARRGPSPSPRWGEEQPPKRVASTKATPGASSSRGRSPAADSAPNGKVARPAKAKSGPRQRADGTLAVRSTGTRADRSRNFR
ncbi:MAG TPA: pseudouridine synthase, partial [Sphingomonas sp.]